MSENRTRRPLLFGCLAAVLGTLAVGAVGRQAVLHRRYQSELATARRLPCVKNSWYNSTDEQFEVKFDAAGCEGDDLMSLAPPDGLAVLLTPAVSIQDLPAPMLETLPRMRNVYAVTVVGTVRGTPGLKRLVDRFPNCAYFVLTDLTWDSQAAGFLASINRTVGFYVRSAQSPLSSPSEIFGKVLVDWPVAPQVP